MQWRAIVLSGTLVAFGCAKEPTISPPSSDNPASPLAAEAPLRLTSQPTALTTTAPTSRKVLYSCPMHPQITLESPGKCPICGMTLVVKTSGGGQP